MKNSSGLSLIAGFALGLIAVTAWAAPPPNNDPSDASENTAGGSGALILLGTGVANTGYGANALLADTDGSTNLQHSTGGGPLAVANRSPQHASHPLDPFQRPR